jgi:hypothetical protein
MSEGYASDDERVRCQEGTKVNRIPGLIFLSLPRSPLLSSPTKLPDASAVHGPSGIHKCDLSARESRSELIKVS